MFGNSEPALLIVDDVPENRALLSRRFGRHGFRTIEAASGVQALNMLNEIPFALVLLDMMMPEMSGLEVLKKIRQQSDPMQLPVIMVTAKADGSDVAEALEAGANDYITKPVDFAAALARVRAQLERKKANDTLREFNEVLEQRINERTADLVQANEQLKQEIAERVRSQAEIHYLAHHDSLTGIANRTLIAPTATGSAGATFGRRKGSSRSVRRSGRLQRHQQFAWTFDRRRTAEKRRSAFGG